MAEEIKRKEHKLSFSEPVTAGDKGRVLLSNKAAEAKPHELLKLIRIPEERKKHEGEWIWLGNRGPFELTSYARIREDGVLENELTSEEAYSLPIEQRAISTREALEAARRGDPLVIYVSTKSTRDGIGIGIGGGPRGEARVAFRPSEGGSQADYLSAVIPLKLIDELKESLAKAEPVVRPEITEPWKKVLRALE